MRNKSISLILGSGGARGMAHIGVIQCLEARGYSIRYISGSSIGALVGGIYAAGKLDEYANWVSELDKTDVLRLLDWSFARGGIFKGEKIIGVLRKLVGERNIEDLSIGFTAVATDLNSEREIWFNHGSLFDAIRASIAVPMIFEPIISGERLLVDGGLINPVPIAPALNNDSQLLIAVDLNTEPEGRVSAEVGQQQTQSDETKNEYRLKLVKFIESMFPVDTENSPNEVPDIFDLMMRSMDAMQTTIARFRQAAYKPDIPINIPRDKCRFFEFYRARELIDFGYRRAGQALDAFEKYDR
jgi:NTE family protein